MKGLPLSSLRKTNPFQRRLNNPVESFVNYHVFYTATSAHSRIYSAFKCLTHQRTYVHSVKQKRTLSDELLIFLYL